MALRTSEWRKLPLTLTELCIDTTLRCGQSFRWRKINDEWHCTLHGRILSLKQDPEHLHYRVTWPKTTVAPLTPPFSGTGTGTGTGTGHCTPDEPPVAVDDDTEALLRNYFNLHHDLTELYKQWADADPNFRKRAPTFTGVRILNQDAWETLVGFICSSNNNISRISQMVHKLCLHYGPYLGTVSDSDSDSDNDSGSGSGSGSGSDEPFHDFPTPAALTGPGVEAHLRSLGFGYRAKYIAETARTISQDRPAGWLDGLRNPASMAWGAGAGAAALTPVTKIKTDDHDYDHDGSDERQPTAAPATYKHAHENLVQLCGVGPKVADCVCLMGLGWGEAVPVDTHVWQIAMRDYKFGGKSKNKTLTKAMYDAVGDHFRGLWGSQAGWAHSVLFTADLRTFSDRLIKNTEEGSGSGPAPKTVKVETVESLTLVTPVATPLATPSKRKRKRAVQAETVKGEGEAEMEGEVEVKEESSTVAATTVLGKRRRTRASR